MMRMVDNNRRAIIAMAMIVAFVAVVVPTCRMIGCSMDSTSSMADRMGVVGLFSDCGGTYVTSSALPASVPASTTMNLLLLMVAVFMAAFILALPPVVVQRIRVHDSDPPPPPQDPQGERLRL